MSHVLGNLAILQSLMAGRIEVTPRRMENIGPASWDLTLGKYIRTFEHYIGGAPVFDIERGIADHFSVVRDTDGYYFKPGEFILAHTDEVVHLCEVRNPLAAWVEGRSSVGRNGVAVHITAGFIDPGFKGQITLEMYNFSPYVFELKSGIRVCQLVFAEAYGVGTFYGERKGSKYQEQMGPQVSLIAKDIELEQSNGG